MKWINKKDVALPVGKTVMIRAINCGCEYMDYVRVEQWRDGEPKLMTGQMFDDVSFIDPDEVTHWMEICSPE